MKNSFKRQADQLMVFAAFFLLYMFSRTRVHGPAEDAWLMIVDFTTLKWTELLHPHHLFYGPLAWMWWKFWGSLGIQNAYATIQTLNCLLGALAVQQVFRFARELGLTRGWSIWAAAASGTSFAWWWLSAEIEVAPLSALIFMVFLRQAHHISNHDLSVSRTITLGILSSLAVAVHVFHLVLPLLGIYALISAPTTISPLRRISYVLLYIGCFLLFMFSFYLTAGIVSGTDQGAARFLVGYFAPAETSGLNWRVPLLFAIGVVRALFGVEILFRIQSVSDFTTHFLPGKDFSDEIFLVKDLNPVQVWVSVILMVLFSLLLILCLVKVLRGLRSMNKSWRNSIVLLLVALVVISVPSLIVGPILYNSTANNEHLLPFWSIIYLLLAGGLQRTNLITSRYKLLAVAIIVFLLFINGLGAIRALHRVENDLTQVGLRSAVELVSENDLVILHLTERDAAAFRYLSGAQTINTMHEPYPSDTYLSGWRSLHAGSVWEQIGIAGKDVKYPSVKDFQIVMLNPGIQF